MTKLNFNVTRISKPRYTIANAPMGSFFVLAQSVNKSEPQLYFKLQSGAVVRVNTHPFGARPGDIYHQESITSAHGAGDQSEVLLVQTVTFDIEAVQ